MKRWTTLAGIAITGLTLACGGGEDETAATAPEVETTAPAEVAETPPAEVEAVVEEVVVEESETADVAASAGDAVQSCLALAAQMKWSEALDPCTQAAAEAPTDLRIKHALQQAQAAAGS